MDSNVSLVDVLIWDLFKNLSFIRIYLNFSNDIDELTRKVIKKKMSNTITLDMELFRVCSRMLFL